MRLLFYIIIAYIIYAVVKKILVSTKGTSRWEGGRARKGEAGDDDDLKTEETVLDPVCGSYVAKGLAIEAVIKGKTHYFCGEQCRDKFDEDSNG